MSIANRRQSTARCYEIQNLCLSHEGSLFLNSKFQFSHSNIRLFDSYFSKLTKPVALPNTGNYCQSN